MLSGSDPDRTVADFLRELGLERRWLLVTRLDSAPPVRDSPTLRHVLGDGPVWVPGGFVIPGAAVDPAELFHGFDEVVVFDAPPGAVDPPPVVFTTDRSPAAGDREALVAYLDAVGAAAAA